MAARPQSKVVCSIATARLFTCVCVYEETKTLWNVTANIAEVLKQNVLITKNHVLYIACRVAESTRW